ncbi:MAG: hypothetical protein ACPL28_10815, partial [bacterium]
MKHKDKKIKKYIAIKSKPEAVKEQLSIIETYYKKPPSKVHGDISIYIGDIRKVLPKLPDNCVDCVITSPPYWQQRDYKHTGQIGRENSYTEYISNFLNFYPFLYTRSRWLRI